MSFQRYLSAKRTVDERALNPRVADRLVAELSDRDRLRVLEVGVGTGGTVERLLARPWLPDRVTYTALDVRPENVAAVRKRLPERAAAMGYSVRVRDDGGDGDDRLVCSRANRRVEVELRTVDAFDFLAATDRTFDLLVAQAFADLVDPLAALAAFRDAVAPDGVIYLPITFDGGTAFEPVADRAFEERLVARFHRHIDRTGDSRAGRHLLASAPDDGEVLAAGSSDWVVRPQDGEYPTDEAFFLKFIVETVGDAVKKEDADDERVSEWVARRKREISEGELVYVAHQLDLLVR